jgi:hypothetical protein
MRINREVGSITLLFALLPAGTSGGSSNIQNRQNDNHSIPALEVRITKQPEWKDGCLKLSVERVNWSKIAIFLPFNGLLIETSVTETSRANQTNEKRRWVAAYGVSDLIINDVKRLAPGQSELSDYCLGPTVAVVNPDKESRREIPLRGRLKVIAAYYPPQEDWQISKAQREELQRTPPAEWKIPDKSRPLSTSFEVDVPCRSAECPVGCRIPPIILPGEFVMVPDVAALNTQYTERGNAIDKELAGMQPSCPD